MTDAPPVPVPDPASPSTALPPARRPGLLRPAALWLLPAAALVLVALVPLVIEPWLAGRIRAAVALAGLELSPQTTIAVSLFGGRVSLAQVDLREQVDGAPRSLFRAERAELDADVLACLSGDIVFDAVVLEGASGDLRRRGDGTIPLATPPPEERGGTDWGRLDWWSHLRKAYEWHQGRERAAGEPATAREARPAEPPRRKPATDWQGAHSYEPAPGPAGPAMRVLIRQLSVSGRELLLPDDTPFAVTSFSGQGWNLGWGASAGDAWGLDLTAETRGAGRIEIGLGTGRVKIAAPALPLQALGHPALAGDAIARHGASGTAALRLESTWTATLAGTIQATVTGLVLSPAKPSPREAEVAQIVNRLGGRPLEWTMVLGGTPAEPRIVDDGVAALVKGSLADAAKQAAIDEGAKRLGEALERNEKVKELQQNPEVKQAVDKGKDLLKGLGR